jgi:metacaspase-1
MGKAISIHIGINEVDPNHYIDGHGNPWSGALTACENDAHSMRKLATDQGFAVAATLLTREATSSRLVELMSSAAQELRAGDTLLLTYSGHGGQLTNLNPGVDPEESDGLDETWCLYDRQILDDELFALYTGFQPGVRVIVLSDSCHSGTVTRGDIGDAPEVDDKFAVVKQPPLDVSLATEKAQIATYTEIQTTARGETSSQLLCAVALISGCQDSQFSRDGRINGAFTSALLKAWNEPEARSSMKDLHAAIVALVPKSYEQTPNYLILPFDGGPALTP